MEAKGKVKVKVTDLSLLVEVRVWVTDMVEPVLVL